MGSFDDNVTRMTSAYSKKEGYILSKWDKDRNKNTTCPDCVQSRNTERTVGIGCHSLKSRFCFLFFFLLLFFSSIPHLLQMSTGFLHLFYPPLFAFRFSWLLFSSISQNDYPGSTMLWQLRVHYFCHSWKCKCYLHFKVNYSWKRRSVWLCLHCWTRSLPYSWAEYRWIFLDQIYTPI